MSPGPAFAPPTPLLRRHSLLRASAVSSPRARPSRVAARPTMQSSNLPNFDEIAEQLSKELQVRRSPKPPGSPMPPVDAPPSEQPFEITVGPNDMPKLNMRHPPSAQEISVFTYGAAVTSWTTRGEDHFWLSDTNKWEPKGKAIRGGIPICFPQFGPYGDLVQHGFARVSEWDINNCVVNEDGSVSAVFGLSSEMKDREAVQAWPYQFEAEYTVTLSYVGLETKLAVTNKGQEPIQFTAAFHNYFKVTKVDNARVFGYEGCKFLNRLDGDKEMPAEEDTGSGLLIAEETDRIYLNAPEELAMFDFTSLKVLKIKKTPTLGDATLWNPFGAEGADPGWENFVCIEPACIKNPAIVQPGETWVGAQLLGVE